MMTDYVVSVVLTVDGLTKPSRTLSARKSTAAVALNAAVHQVLRLEGLPDGTGRVTHIMATVRPQAGE